MLSLGFDSEMNRWIVISGVKLCEVIWCVLHSARLSWFASGSCLQKNKKQ